VAAVERAISAAGHVIVDMADFPAADQPAAQVCAERVQGCDVYVGVLGTRYGSLVRDRPEVSYTELEFDIATKAGLDRLVFLLDTSAEDVGIPVSALIDREFGVRQDGFRRRVQDSGLVTQPFADPAALGQLVERSLRELAEKRRHVGSASPRGQVPVVVGEIPQEPLGFQPRADLLAALDAPGPGTRVSVVHAVTGMRGVGKTHLAAAYARARLAEGWRLVAWINAEDLGGMVAGLTAIATQLGLGTANVDAEAAGRAVRHRLEIDGDRCLVVFDNATDPEALQPFMPAAGAARVIITSNQQSMANLGAGVPVEVFSEQEALTFLAARTGNPDAAGAAGLAEELGYLPLALAQAAAVIASQHLAYGTYLARLHSIPVGDLLPPVTAGQYPRGAAAAILLSLGSVRTGDSAEVCSALMDLLAVLSPAGVPRLLLQAAVGRGLSGNAGESGALAAEAVADRALAQLAGASLLVFSVDGASVSAHRLVMRVIRDQLAKAGTLAAECESAAQLLMAQAETLDRTWYEDRPAVRNLVEQITALHESTARCPEDSGLIRQMIRLRAWAVLFLNHLGDSTVQSISIGEPLLADQERVLGADHPDTLNSRNHLARAFQSAGRLDEAIPLHERTLADRERVLGDTHPDTLNSRNNLARAYWGAGRLDEAIPLYERTLADYERILGDRHPETLASRNNVARAWMAAGRLDEAISLFERTLADCEQVLGNRHPLTLALRNNLARAWMAAGRLDEAISLFERTLADRERVLGDTHPYTLASRNDLAAAYQSAGRLDEAISLLERTLADRERVLGDTHPDTLASRNDLASAHQAAGRSEEERSER
jgi:tetratricopeptide (TPR) repeat protein